MPGIVRRAARAVAAVALSLAAATVAAPPAAAVAAATGAASPRAAAAHAAAQLVARRPAALHPSRHDAFVRLPVIDTPDGLQYVPYERTHKGLPVVGGDFVVVMRSSRVLSTSVAQQGTLDISASPTLTAAQAGQIAAARLSGPSTPHGTRLVILAKTGSPALAYESVVAGHRGTLPSRLHVFVDAHSGDVLLTEDDVKAGSGTGWINGPTPLSIDTSASAGTFSMTDPVRAGVSCRDDVTNAVLSGPDDVWGNGDGTDVETGCVDALWGVQQQWDMLAEWLGRNGINGTGGGLPVYVGGNFENAFFDGLSVSIGHNPAMRWVSSMDIVGHEFGHAIDFTTPGGLSSASVLEFTADVFGALTEAYANESEPYDPPDYSVGEEIDLHGNGPIRYMHQPSLLGHPDCWSSAVSAMSPHVAAGPGNHWFYLLAEGSAPADGPASPTCDGSTLEGLGVRTAGRIFYNAMLSKTSGMTYPRYRSATMLAAGNLFPGDCTAYDAVKAAWDAVGVPAQPTDLPCGASARPIAVDDAYAHFGSDTALTVNSTNGVLANDGFASAAALVTGPGHGSLTLATRGSFSYQPDEDYTGTDSFTYRATAGALVSDVATVTITVGAGCNRAAATLVGTAGGDRLIGTPGRDVIAALGGADVVVGHDGDDVLCGGSGRDLIQAGAGDDRLSGGGDGPDICTGNAGFDSVDATCERVSSVP